MKKIIFLVSILFLCNTFSAHNLFVETESFENKGGWVVDQQFMDLMGSSYLMAHGLGRPVEDASTTVYFPEGGTYNIYVRTFNWTSPWFGGEGPGKFQLKVNGKKVSGDLGTRGDAWMWQSAGKVSVKKGNANIALHDLTGFNGRCDAIYFATDENDTPPSDVAELEAFRKKMTNIPDMPENAGTYDLVVVGGGIAGMCAAVSASRLGCKVALINDRPVLGGNNSSEIRVHLGGRIESGPYKELGNLIKEFGPERFGNAKPAEYYEDDKKMKFVSAEKNIEVFLNYRAMNVTMDGRKIKSVVAKHIENGKEIEFRGLNFADCTGDGTIGYLAGADFLMGRESRSDYGEDMAPETADKMTMGSSVQWYSAQEKNKVTFPKFKYGLEFTEDNCEKVKMGEWQWETGMNFDQIKDFERVRDYGLLVVFSNWSFLKNEKKNNQEYNNLRLDWVAYIAGKRESRRLLGDYILKQDDLTKNVFHEDASAATTWTIDLHFPDPENSKKFPGREFKSEARHRAFYPYGIPYRCLYSRNVDNLFMAGRNISVTHVALGTVRVMRTTGMMGEVVGMAASLGKKYNATPREVYRSHLPELRKLMEEGAGKKGLPNNQLYNEGGALSEPPVVR
ncbi:FAD-dependent oxidoreductase [Dysgonomonas sp. 520]|uniref:FAD-dependent oxidoreductase n=1 Tax=Dysgonomonas sp. 520 TaxID=2302931 RepID=UPI0013D5F215|nr:FAD-dependent oxidoreductase [Dysgonomonas sp. 520]NDW10773.1 FAD-dependent oxidoreductase [Dysgonomonas sp. 520]